MDWTSADISNLCNFSPTLRKYKTNLHAILSGIPQRQTKQKWKVKVDSVKIFLHKQLFQISTNTKIKGHALPRVDVVWIFGRKLWV